MKTIVILLFLGLVGCVTTKTIDPLSYVCPTAQEFFNMIKTSNTSKCRRVIDNYKVIDKYEITIDVPDPNIGGILPVTVREIDGTKFEGYMSFPRVYPLSSR